MCDRIDEAFCLDIILEFVQEYYKKVKDQEEKISSHLEDLVYQRDFDRLYKRYENILHERIYLGRMICSLKEQREKVNG